jgi:hypothetical protein
MLDAFPRTEWGAAAIIANEAELSVTKGAAYRRAVPVPVLSIFVVAHVRLLWVLRRSYLTSHVAHRWRAASES